MEARIERLTVQFGTVIAVDDLSIEIHDGEMLALVGPSGCGKTTTLGFVAGFSRAGEGRLFFDERDVTSLSPQRRNVGYVFQDYAIYPHMSVRDNIRFPLRVGRVPRTQMEERVEEIARLAGVEGLLDRQPHQLSGGQRQRVALARALVKRPSVLLLDEPFSNLDAHLRVQTRAEVRKLQRELGMTTILVTHDQAEALAIADRVAVMSNGRIVGVAGAKEMYSRPPSLFIARFIGLPQMNLWPLDDAEAGFARTALGELSPTDGVGKFVVGVRPEDLRIDPAGVPGTITLSEVLGQDTLLHVHAAGSTVRMIVPTADSGSYADGAQVGLRVRPGTWHAFDGASGERIELGLPATSGTA